MQYQGPLELILEDGILKDVRERAGWWWKPIAATSAASAAEPGWGEPMEGLSVRLQSDSAVLYFCEGIALLLSVRNLGHETFAVPESQEPGELEMDGVWHSYWCSWSDPYYVARRPLPPGQQFDNIAVLPVGGDWRKDSAPLNAQAGKHTIRFAVAARRAGPNGGQTLRAVSNPVEVEFRWDAPPR